MFLITVTRLGIANSSTLLILNKGLSIVKFKILDKTSNNPKPATPAAITAKTRLSVIWDVRLKLLEINRVPINHPNNHKRRKDLCIIPPATAIMKKRIIAKVLIDADLISSSVKRLAEAKKVTQAKTARGPNGCVNS